ncbi:CDP-glycerol glycerophosphotransferase family protein [Specibacter sp. NPDC078692]|uniref:bifunctional glycosyltransferase/CDP-glycerol:glycerophosphate glycerophosphotransferase n=1 Tax=Specibacter sp. NPDC078692 TaxID=3155818 RepID=UPI0034394395
MTGVTRKVFRRLPAGLKTGLKKAVHPARRSRLQRALGARITNLGLLSVIIPIFDVEEFLADCLNSVTSQSYPYIEILLVDDGSTDGSLAIARDYARRDKRISIIEREHSGNGRARNVAIAAANGQYLTFADSDDVVADHAYLAMMTQLEESGSDFVVGSSDRLIGNKHVPTKLSSRLHENKRVAITINDFPEILDDVFLWNKVFKREFWDTKVGPIPEDILYEDQETTARAFIRARQFDVLDINVYSWRQRPGSSSITQGKADLQNLQDRLTVAQDVSHLILSESNAMVAQTWYKRLFGSDMVRYFDFVANRGDDYWQNLCQGSTSLLQLFAGADVISQTTINSLDPHARVFLSLAQHGNKDAVEAVIVDRQETGTGFEVRLDGDTFNAVPNYSSQIGLDGALESLTCTPESLVFESAIKLRDLRDGRGLILKGYAFIRGLNSERSNSSIRCSAEYADGSTIELLVARVVDARIDIDANDAFASHAEAGFEILLADIPNPERVKSFIIGHGVAEAQWSTTHRTPPGDFQKLAQTALIKSPLVCAFEVDLGQEEFTISVEWAGTLPSKEVYLSTAQERIDPYHVTTGDSGRVNYSFALRHSRWNRAVFSYPAGAYTLRQQGAESAKAQPIKASPNITNQGPLDFLLEHSALTAWSTTSQAFAVTIAPPLDLIDRSKFGQRLIHKRFQDFRTQPRAGHFVFESFNGKFCTDSPRAIADQLHKLEPEKAIYFSITDFSVPYPDYAIPIVRGSAKWASRVQSASHLINNNNFPFYFRKNPHQFYLQTWHGTPLKKIGLDAPTEYLSASYRRLMDREAKMWDLLLAQNPFSARVFPTAFGYNGPILECVYPRNDALITASALERRAVVRNELGIANEQVAVLYAPTWRDNAIAKNGSRNFVGYLDGDSLRKNLGNQFVLLNRGHHNSPGGAELRSKNVIEVSSYPEINDLMLASDLLVTDFSSIIFDYALLKNPIYALVPDIDSYGTVTRGFYEDYRLTIPFPKFSDKQDFFDHLVKNGLEYDAVERANFKRRFNQRTSGESLSICLKNFFQ